MTAWQDAWNAGDADKIAAMYAEDGVVMAPGVPVAKGRDAIRESITKDIASAQAAGVKLKIDHGDTGVSGDLAWHSGSYTISAADGSAVDTGSYLELRRNVGGQWLIARDIWNSDRPPAVAPGESVRVVRFTAASAEAQEAAMQLVDDEIHALYQKAKGFLWVKYFRDPKTLATGSMSAWQSAEDVDAFLKSEGYQPIPGKLKPLMKGAMVSDVYTVHEPTK
jgi:uncharacterized protein (TIGR02246 family)